VPEQKIYACHITKIRNILKILMLDSVESINAFQLDHKWTAKCTSQGLGYFAILKGQFTQKSSLSSFDVTHAHVIPNLYEFHSFVEHKRRYFEECCLSDS